MTTVVIIALAYTLFLQTVLLQDNLDITSNIAALGCYAMLERVLKATNEFIVAYFIMRPFKLAATQHISQAIADRSPSALLLMKGNAYTFHTSAVRALTSLVENGIGLITPIVLLVSRGAAIGLYLTAEQTLIVFACLTFVFLAGSAILIYDHRVKEKLSKTETAVEERARSVMTSIATVVINGAASVLPKWMTALKMEEIIPSTRHDVAITAMYGVLEIATTGIPIALVWQLKENGNGSFLPLYIVIQPMFWNSWYLFWTIKSLVVSTAPWIQFEDFMNETPRRRSPDLREPVDSSEMMHIFKNTAISEVALIGPSGCGKTTFMKKIIADICDEYALGFIIYIDQFACLPLGQTIYEYFACSFPQPDNLPASFEDDLLKVAYRLGISNLVNKDRLYASISNPSGGEKKRLIFLKHVFPIITGRSKVMIVFLDEVSAGLDPDSFDKVRAIIEKIKILGVKVVSIDHHGYNGENILNVEVYKEIRKIPSASHPPPTPAPTGSRSLTCWWWWKNMMFKMFPRTYQPELGEREDARDLENEEGDTTVVVWAPALGVDKPE